MANYSQLLRFFGELSGELVDLGQCIMLSQRRPSSPSALLAPREPLASLAGRTPPHTSYLADPFEQQQQRPSNWNARRSSQQQQQHDHHYGQTLGTNFWQQANTMQQPASIRPSASSSSQLAGCCLRYAPANELLSRPELAEAEEEPDELEHLSSQVVADGERQVLVTPEPLRREEGPQSSAWTKVGSGITVANHIAFPQRQSIPAPALAIGDQLRAGWPAASAF